MTTLTPIGSIQQQNGTKLRIKKYGEPSKLKLAGAASLHRETNNSSELMMSKKYNADPTEWLTGSLIKTNEPRRQSKLESYHQDDPLPKGLSKAPSTRILDTEHI